MGLLDKLLFWRNDEPEFDVEGCFTLPGAELDGDDAAEEAADCAPTTVEATPTDEA